MIAEDIYKHYLLSILHFPFISRFSDTIS